MSRSNHGWTRLGARTARATLTIFALSIASVVFSVALPSAAQPTGAAKAPAQALFDDGLAAMKRGSYAEACPKLEESDRLDPAIGTKFRLAECYEATNRPASAWGYFTEAADLAYKHGDAERERIARERATKVASRLSYVLIAVATPDLPGLEIKRDGALVGRAQWGKPMPVDPGEHTVEASAPKKAPWQATTTVQAAGAQGTTARVDVPVLVDLALEQPTVSPGADRPGAGATQRTLALVIGSAGVVGLGVGGVLALSAKSTFNDSSDHCQFAGGKCDPEGKDMRDRAASRADVATIVMAVGGSALIGGAVLWITAPDSRTEPKVARGTTTVGVAPTGLLLRTTF